MMASDCMLQLKGSPSPVSQSPEREVWDSSQVETDERCALAHVDISPRNGLDPAVEDVLRKFVDTADEAPRTTVRSVLQLISRPNHFEIIGRFASDDAYLAHLVAPSNLVLPKSIAPVLASPSEDRVHGPRGQQSWPAAVRGDLVIISQVEARPQRLAAAERCFDELAAVRLAVGGIEGQVALQRRHQPNKLELISVWSSPEAFDDHLAAPSQKEVRRALEGELLAPVDDRRCTLIAGAWATE